MDNHTSTALELIKNTLLFLEQNSDPIYADATDCDYFRKKFKKTDPISAPVAPVIIKQAPVSVIKPEPAPIFSPPVIKPVIIETPKIVEEPVRAPVKPLVFSTEWASIFTKIAPNLMILKNPPSDAVAKKINTRWKTKNQTAPITILYFQEIPEQKALLEEITKALDIYFGPAKLVFAEPIEREKQWEALLTMPELSLVICCDYTLWQLGALMKFYKETPAQKKEIAPYCGLQGPEETGIVAPMRSQINRQLGDKPLFLLPDLSLYLKDPLLKRSLWKALCQTLSTPQ